ncbi:MAG: S-adenosylmethionine:tRNA ribosyltransferase-isomerase [Chloroflexi bacterium]|nr:S-adenosylmethionine:tRNA ribosyltransferase-isomerase [Chloroflexota bacterium]
MKTSDFDYSLPPELIAQTPVEPRDRGRLMVLDRSDGSLKHQRFREIVDYLRAGDVLLFNDSRVIPARLSGKRVDDGGGLEILLLRRLSPGVWETLVRPGKRVKIGTRMEISSDSVNGDSPDFRVTAEAVGLGEGGTRVISFSDETRLPALGKIPLPPYIHVPLPHPERYQTVYANVEGGVAAPTAGLHFTPELIARIKSKGVRCLFVTLHAGLDTFRPVRQDNPLEHPIHREYGLLSQEVADELSQARTEGRRIVCVGTTDIIKQAYQEAIARQYRFYSFGDAMLIL